MKRIPFPKNIDAPPQMLFWQADEFVPFVGLVILGMVLNQLLLFTLLGLGVSLFMRRNRSARLEGFLVHWLWWRGLMPTKARAAINPFRRRIESA
jgi:conjugal transfer pilus assembly protein TraL